MSRVVRRMSILVTAVAAGIFIISALAALKIDNTFFNRDFQMELLTKYDIYSQTGKTIKTFISGIVADNINNASPENREQQKQLFSLVDKAVAPNMIKLNLDMFIDGLLKYLRSETRFLPDIYLNPVRSQPLKDIPTISGPDGTVPEESLSGIDRINFSVILMYLSRNDIIEELSIVRLVQFFTANLPGFIIILVILCLFSGIALVKKNPGFISWLFIAALSAGLAGLGAGMAILAYIFIFLPQNTAYLAIFLPLTADTINGYIKSCILPTAVSLLSAGLVSLSLCPVIKLLPKFFIKTAFYRHFERSISLINIKKEKRKIIFPVKYSKAIICSLLILLTLISAAVKVQALKSDFHSRDLTVVLDRMKGTSTFTKVISASDENIYSLEIRIINSKSNLPVQGVPVNISGKLVDNKKTSYIQSKTSDENGIIKLPIGKGAFSISFSMDWSNKEYILPSTIFFNVKSPGNTIITVNLNEADVEKPGTAEFEILGRDDKPVHGIELTIEKQQAAEYTGRTYSFTNTEGVAVFRVPSGAYKVRFLENGFPDGYVIPEPYSINVFSDYTVRFTIKLVSEAKPSPAPTPGKTGKSTKKKSK